MKNEKCLLNTAINLLLEENYSIRLECHNPITFSFKYYNYKFYLMWYSKIGYEDILYLEYRIYLQALGCSRSNTLEYSEIVKQRDDDIDFKLENDYISCILELYFDDYNDLTYNYLRTCLDQILKVLRYLEVDLKTIMQIEYEDIEEEILRFRKDDNDPNWYNDVLELDR